MTCNTTNCKSLALSLEVSILDALPATALLLHMVQLENTEENVEVARENVEEFGYLALATFKLAPTTYFIGVLQPVQSMT